MTNEKKDFTQWLEEGCNKTTSFQFAKRLMLADGTSLSIQASDGHYSEPRKTTSYSRYESFEIGFPSCEIPEINRFAEDESDLTQTVYPYVPKQIIIDLIDARGGVSGFYIADKGE